MDTDAFARLEERINKAVAHIDELTTRNGRLKNENTELKQIIDRLEKELEDQKKALTGLEEQSSQVSEKVRDKIERLLTKIDNYDKDLS